jgi:hypothetical protein
MLHCSARRTGRRLPTRDIRHVIRYSPSIEIYHKNKKQMTCSLTSAYIARLVLEEPPWLQVTV